MKSSEQQKSRPNDETSEFTGVSSHGGDASAQSNFQITTDFGTSPPKPGGHIGPYKLLQVIGEGGMGVVFMAEQEQPVRRKVALKVIKPGMDSRQVVARFEAERQALAMMDHPNIAHVLDAGTTDAGLPFFAMELVRGVPITDYCDREKLSTNERLRLFINVCHAVQHAHQKGIIHRDIKPSNVLVMLHDGAPIPKVIDFGIAKAMGQSLTEKTLFTHLGQPVGTPAYMSPEQIEMSGLDVDTRTDIYSLGVMLYELLTGTTPFQLERFDSVGLPEMQRMIREEEPPRPSTRLSTMGDRLSTVASSRRSEPSKLGSSVRGELDWIVMKTLEKDRTRRYETANGFALDIERFLNHEMVLARPPSASYRFQKFVRRNQGWLTAAAIVLVALVAATAISTWQAIRATNAERTANENLLLVEEQRDRAVLAEKEASDQRTRAEIALKKEEEARLAAKAEQQVAERERRQAEEVSDILVEMFGSPDPEREGWRVTVAEALDLWAAPIATEFSGDPVVKSKLLHVVGKTFRALGDPKKAVTLLEEAKKIRNDALGPLHADTLETSAELAEAYYHAGRRDESEKLYDATILAMENEFGAEDIRTLVARRRLANRLLDAGDAVRAVPIFEDVVAKMKSSAPSNTIELLVTQGNLAFARMRAGDAKAAIALQESTLDAFRKALGERHPRTVAAMSLLGHLQLQSKNVEQATELFEKTHALRQEILGPNHVLVFAAAANLGQAYRQSGRVQEAIELYEKTLPAMITRLGERHPRVLVTRNSLAVARASSGELARARRELEALLKSMDEVMGEDAPETLNARTNLINILLTSNDFPAAIALQRELLNQLNAKYGSDDARTRQAKELLDSLAGFDPAN